MDELLDEVKDYLKITWNDEDTSINKLILEAKQYLDEKLGTAVDYTVDLVALGLLKDYCRYVRNYSKEYFEKNFLNEILNLQLKYSITGHGKKSNRKILVTEDITTGIEGEYNAEN